ncbi:MAG: HPr family phosphocarrier protein [Oscillospiraceae bacterium]|nr:HPr family phosphocarrier protein [Oscillospiraceae bacterium]
MVEKSTKIIDEQGLHMRPANNFVSAIVKYKSNITIIHNGNEINGRSIMNIMAACIKCGNEITIRCEGEDEEAMLNEAISLIEGGLE